MPGFIPPIVPDPCRVGTASEQRPDPPSGRRREGRQPKSDGFDKGDAQLQPPLDQEGARGEGEKKALADYGPPSIICRAPASVTSSGRRLSAKDGSRAGDDDAGKEKPED